MSPSTSKKSQRKVKANSKNNNKITKYATQKKAGSNMECDGADDFTVADSVVPQVSQSLTKHVIVDPVELKASFDSYKQTGDISTMLSVMVDAYSSLANSAQTNDDNCTKIAQALDENSVMLHNTADHLNDEYMQLSNKHYEYVESNENDKLEMKVKADIRYFKSQMIIYLKNDERLKTITNDAAVHEANQIISECGLSLEKAYISKAVILSGMKKINNVNKFVKYLYVYFSDTFTAERLMMEMIHKNKKSSNPKQPNFIFTQPSSYDINRVKNICNELRQDGSISKVFFGDDSIKVTLNKQNPNDKNEVAKKFHVRTFSDIDTLRNKVRAKNFKIPTKMYYNKDYWNKKYPDSKSGEKTEKRKAIDDPETPPSNKKKPRNCNEQQDDDDDNSTSSHEMSSSTILNQNK